MSMQAIRDRYGVPAKRGKVVKFEGESAVILSAPGHHLNLMFIGTCKRRGPYHPLWHIDYLDGIDHGAAYDARIKAFNAVIARSRPSSPVSNPPKEGR